MERYVEGGDTSSILEQRGSLGVKACSLSLARVYSRLTDFHGKLFKRLYFLMGSLLVIAAVLFAVDSRAAAVKDCMGKKAFQKDASSPIGSCRCPDGTIVDLKLDPGTSVYQLCKEVSTGVQCPTSPFSVADLDGSNGFMIHAKYDKDYLGVNERPASAGDINDDGVVDFMISAYHSENDDASANEERGELYVLFGGEGIGASGSIDLDDLDGSNGFMVYGKDKKDHLGARYTLLGDVNSDGVDDIAVSAPRYDVGPFDKDRGRVYVLFGAAGIGAGGSFDVDTLDGSNGFIITGLYDYDRLADVFGGDVMGGDINGDGISDVIVGTTEEKPGRPNDSGQYFVIYGHSSIGSSGSSDLNTLNGTNGFAIYGSASNDDIGSTAVVAGDVNDDGYQDIMLMSSYGSTSYVYDYMVFGGASLPHPFYLSNLDGSTNGFRIRSYAPKGNSFYGGPAGDFNNDGVDDFIMGAPQKSNYSVSNYPGRAFLVYGEAGLSGEGSDDYINISTSSGFSLDGNNGVVFHGIADGDRVGRRIGNAGDLNNDGISDLVVAGGDVSSPFVNGGQVYVIYGSSSFGHTNGEFTMDELDGSNGYIVNPTGDDDELRSGFGIGDVNVDGVDDVILLAYEADSPGLTQSGQGYVIFGSPNCP